MSAHGMHFQVFFWELEKGPSFSISARFFQNILPIAWGFVKMRNVFIDRLSTLEKIVKSSMNLTEATRRWS
jgi:hypothetical protein